MSVRRLTGVISKSSAKIRHKQRALSGEYIKRKKSERKCRKYLYMSKKSSTFIANKKIDYASLYLQF